MDEMKNLCKSEHMRKNRLLAKEIEFDWYCADMQNSLLHLLKF